MVLESAVDAVLEVLVVGFGLEPDAAGAVDLVAVEVDVEAGCVEVGGEGGDADIAECGEVEAGEADGDTRGCGMGLGEGVVLCVGGGGDVVGAEVLGVE